MYRSQTNNIKHLTKKQKQILREQCSYAAKLYNLGLKYIKQSWDNKDSKLVTYYDNCKLCINEDSYRMLNSRIAQQTLKKASESFSSFIGQIKSNSPNARTPKNKIFFPKPKQDNEFYKLIIVGNNVMSKKSLERGWFKLPLSSGYKKHKNVNSNAVIFPVPKNLIDKTIKEITIMPSQDGQNFKIRYVYLIDKINNSLDKNNYLAIDTGVTNFATCVTSAGLQPFILDGKQIKSINYNWFKQKEYYYNILNKQKIKGASKRIKKITQKRNNQINFILNKYVKYICKYCCNNDIGNVVLGYNIGIKTRCKMNYKNKNNFFYIPYYSFKIKLQACCEKYNINFIEQEESYTSKSSFIDSDILPERVSDYDWSNNFSGTRIKRGLYKTKNGFLINADVNGAYNILRKCNQNFNFEKLSKDGLKPPIRIRL